jgi:uncharacterized protein
MPDDTFTLDGADGAPIRGDVFLPQTAGAPLVVILPGFKGFKDWGFFPWLGRALADAGMATVVVSLSHCGVAGNGEIFDREDLFEADTWGRRLHDLREIIAAAERGVLTARGEPNPARLGLLGHSMGGALALIAAARDGRVRAVGTLACTALANRIPSEVVEAQLREFGHVKVRNARTGQTLRVGRGFFDELRAASAFAIPWLLVHGSQDETVPMEEAYALLHAAEQNPLQGTNAKLLVLDGTGHTFGVGHPFTGPTEDLSRAADALAAHFLRAL